MPAHPHRRETILRHTKLSIHRRQTRPELLRHLRHARRGPTLAARHDLTSYNHHCLLHTVEPPLFQRPTSRRIREADHAVEGEQPFSEANQILKFMRFWPNRSHLNEKHLITDENLHEYHCRDAAKIDKTRLAILTRLGRVAGAC